MKQFLKRLPLFLFGVLILSIALDLALPDRLEVVTETVVSARLPGGFAGFRVVQLSDLHGEVFGEGQSELLAMTAAEKPELIAITGDLFDLQTDMTIIEPLLTALLDIAPVYYVTGNHEWTTPQLREKLRQFEALGVQVLANEYTVLTRGGSQIVLAGVHDPNGPYDMKTPAELVSEIRQELGDPYILMLAHRNDHFEEWTQLQVDTVLTGHGHGGVLRLPFVGGLLSTDRTWFPAYDAGVYTRGRTSMVVSRGLGYSGPRLRLFNPPEVLTAVLQPES